MVAVAIWSGFKLAQGCGARFWTARFFSRFHRIETGFVGFVFLEWSRATAAHFRLAHANSSYF